MKISRIVVDDEFSGLVFRPTDDEYSALKTSINEHGMRRPLLIDQTGVLLDGHTRLQIARDLEMDEVPTETVCMQSRLEAMEYIIEVNVQRRHLNVAQRAELGKRLLPIEAGLAKERQKEAGKKFGRGKLTQRVAEAIDEGMSRDLAAAKVGISGETLREAVRI